MTKFVIQGGQPLHGAIQVAGSKNAVLPSMAASLLTDQPCTIKNVPEILDVKNFIKILRELGAQVTFKNHILRIRCRKVRSPQPNPKLVKSMRASVVLLGTLLGRLGRANVNFPGGDKIGPRPIDIHLRAFERLGAKVTTKRSIRLAAKKLKGAELFAESSVTGTENMLLAAVLASGTTVIKLAAGEPHVQQLGQYLNKMGAKISGLGTPTLTIKGVRKLRGASIRIIPDEIEAGTLAILAAATRSQLEIREFPHEHLDAVYNKFLEMGVPFDKKRRNLIIKRSTGSLRPAIIRTGVYPNLPTDLQPPFGVLATQAKGTSYIHDWIWEGRLGYLEQLARMGAKIKAVDAHHAQITGPTPLLGSNIESLDIRSGMTLVIAALVAKGKSEINDIHHIDRGYERLDERLRGIGADIQRVE